MKEKEELVKVVYIDFENGKKISKVRKGIIVDDNDKFLRIKTLHKYHSINKDFIISVSDWRER